jgi:hypothetical protein
VPTSDAKKTLSMAQHRLEWGKGVPTHAACNAADCEVRGLKTERVHITALQASGKGRSEY